MLHLSRITIRIVVSLLILVLAVGSGYLLGRAGGRVLLKRLVIGANPLPLLLATPAGEYARMYAMLNSENPLQRLAGYYGLLEYRMTDARFLTERYDSENDPVIRRTIIWLMGFGDDDGFALRLFDRIYEESTVPIRAEILRSMERINRGKAGDFRLRHGVKP